MKKCLLNTIVLVLMANFSLISVAQTNVNPVQVAASLAGVSPATPWFKNDTRTGGTVSFVNGPATPPLGCGSLQLTTTDALGTSQAKAQLFSYGHIGTPLSAITSLGYWTYKSSSSTNSAAQTIAINIEVDFVGDGSSYTTLVFEPVYQSGGVGALLTDTWQYWDAFNGGNAVWWSTRNIPGALGSCCGNPSPDYVTWNSILAANPNAKIKFGFGINVGSGWAGQFSGATDGLTINATVYNFESSHDTDNDGLGDACDTDDDNDGVPDAYDCEPINKKKNKWLICHNGRTQCVAGSAVAAHLAHGDVLGTCPAAPRGGSPITGNEYEELYENYRISSAPNPATSQTIIRYELPVDSRVNITLFDPMGRIVTTLVDASRAAGSYFYNLDASKLAAGLYYYKMTAVSGDQKFVQSQKLMILK